ncbi:hypothetical protein RBH26_19520 [Natronolimnohabitans sp. A-GB9]|uniref:hypothetical protein n=1 Tax=Natronolimnohabitans sp. A-GB9 TaxID=3069757 RepID=UPI0027B26B65|nr:hypothetical protein [Natronolimnohabitans sp. A-GB9]MDQ2052651.1 hypothetical protein [Natronolimnohabitans sp. A-GB9]
MKSGATDPFADDDGVDEEDEQDVKPVEQSSQTDESDQPDEPPVEADTSAQSTSNTRQFDRSDLPRIITRQKVKEDRDDVHQLFVYEDTAKLEKEARRELEDRFENDVYKLDLREAIYRAGMENLDDAESVLREWGADI